MDLAPLDKVLNEDSVTSSKEKMKSSESSENRAHQRKGIVHSIKLGKKNPSKRDKVLRKHQTMRKRDCHQARKDFNKKKEMKRIECKNFHQDERKMIYQKTQEK